MVLLYFLSNYIFLYSLAKIKCFKKNIGGLSSVLTSIIFGDLFVFTQNDIFSFLMAMSFIGALINYAKVAFSKE